MATFLLQAAGQAVGSAIGGPFGGIVGRIVGGVAGAYIDSALLGQSGRPIEGPRLSDLNGISSTEGAPIPRVYGRARLGGQVIWATAFEEAVGSSRASSGGKGGSGGAPRQTTYSYYANAAIALCEGPIGYVRRVWADGELLDLSKATMRVYRGTEDQAPDPLIVAKDGAALATAYRGTAYVVFERLPLADYGNRLPQLTFEIVSPVAGLADDIRAVNIIPGSGEFVYDTRRVSRNFTYGSTQSENRHQYSHDTDWAASLDQLQALCPNLGSVSLVVSWFGDDLRAGRCTVAPRVDLANKITHGENWRVAGLSRGSARLSSKVEGRAAYGGTPSDGSVIRAIRDLKARGLAVTLYPFIMMDVAAGNTLPDPWGGAAGQPAYPWRGRLTCHPAPGVTGSPDGTSAAAEQVSALFGKAATGNFSIVNGNVNYGGAAEWSLRRQVLHYAHLAKAAGGVDAFLIGSEMVALTRVQSGPGVYPAVAALEQLAQDVRAVLGPDTKISYAADWTEYGAHVTGEGDVRFPLDPLWASSAIDFVGIDWYPPLSDWRDGRAHADAAIASGPLALDYLTERVASGEAFDWYYADDAGRAAQQRLPITDGLGKPWTFRQKDLAGWWLNAHHERIGGVEAPEPTAWVPGSKPIRLTEIGCPAVDRGANAPNVFPDFKVGAAGLPYFSRGSRDDLAQNRAITALLRHFDARLPGHPAGANPISPVSGLAMVDADHLAIWAWDARPYPAFPHLTEIWSDGENWLTGHWLNGRLEGVPLEGLVRQIASDFGALAVDSGLLDGFVEGYVIDRTMSARNAIEPLAALFGFDGVERAGTMTFVRRDGAVAMALDERDLVPDRDGQLLNLTRGQESELPHEISFTVVDAENDYRSISVSSRRLEGASRSTSRNDVAVATRRAVAQRLSDIALQEIWVGRETLAARLRPGLIGIEVGDTLAFTVDGQSRLFRLTRITDGAVREIEARAIEPTIQDTTIGPSPLHSISSPPVPGPPHVEVLDLPFSERDQPVLQYLAVAANPWPNGFTLWRSVGGESFAARETVVFPALVGETQSELRPGPLWRFDRGNTLDVALSGNGLSSIDPLRMLAGENLIAVKGPDGAWELIGYAGAELIGERLWRLSTLLRGLGASEALAARTLPPGAPVVVIDQALVPLTDQIDDLFRDYEYRLTPAGADLGDPAAIGFTASATPLALTPYAPVAARARRQEAGIALSWIRRTRRGGDSWDIAEVPLSEEREAYEVDILSGGLVLRTLSATAPSLLYADELADFGVAQATLSLRICQLSTIIGRGLPLLADIPVR